MNEGLIESTKKQLEKGFSFFKRKEIGNGKRNRKDRNDETGRNYGVGSKAPLGHSAK